MTNKIWGITKRHEVVVSPYATTKAGAYSVNDFGKVVRKFRTRNEARSYKKTLKNPQLYSIVNTEASYVSR